MFESFVILQYSKIVKLDFGYLNGLRVLLFCSILKHFNKQPFHFPCLRVLLFCSILKPPRFKRLTIQSLRVLLFCSILKQMSKSRANELCLRVLFFCSILKQKGYRFGLLTRLRVLLFCSILTILTIKLRRKSNDLRRSFFVLPIL